VVLLPGRMTTVTTPLTAAAKLRGTAAHPRAILAIVLVSYFMILLDNSIVFTGVPAIQQTFGMSPAGLSWVQDAYALVFGGLLLLGARLGDLFGRRRVFVIGLLEFVIASALVGFAPTGHLLILARGLQGIGAAIVAPSSLALLMASFPEGPARSRAVGYYGATAGIGASLGLLIGGAAATWTSWRVGFLINVPIGLVMIAMAPRYLRETPRTTGRFDLAGSLLATFGVGSLVFGVIASTGRGWADPVVIGSLVASAVLLTALVLNERRAAQPIMPLRLFADPRRSASYAARALYMGAMIGFFFFTTQLMQDDLGFTAIQAGIGFLPMTVVNFAVALAIPRILRRFGASAVLAAGVTLTAIGMLWLSRAGVADSYFPAVAVPMLLLGAGQGLTFAPLTSFGIVGTARDDAGAASGLLNTFHQLGLAIGLAVLVAVSTSAPDFSAQFTDAIVGASAFLASCLAVVLLALIPAQRRATA
jgi:EmrB/QacA subfamily drug resistance transporter